MTQISAPKFGTCTGSSRRVATLW